MQGLENKVLTSTRAYLFLREMTLTETVDFYITRRFPIEAICQSKFEMYLIEAEFGNED